MAEVAADSVKLVLPVYLKEAPGNSETMQKCLVVVQEAVEEKRPLTVQEFKVIYDLAIFFERKLSNPAYNVLHALNKLVIALDQVSYYNLHHSISLISESINHSIEAADSKTAQKIIDSVC